MTQVIDIDHPVKDRVKQITDELEKGVAELFRSDRYRDYLSVMGRFYHYSPNNSLLIALQRPDATHVAGFQSWKTKFDRRVNHGEKAIHIIAPCPFKFDREVTKKDTFGNEYSETETIEGTKFRIAYVFDVSQTSGKPLPEIVHKLDGSFENYDAMYQAIEKLSPVPIRFADISSGANGYYSHADKEIVLQQGMSQTQTIKTMIHEVAHAKLHGTDEARKLDTFTKEVQAESVAYTVCSRYGLDTSDYSFGYIAGWSSDREATELKDSLQVICDTSSEIIAGIESELQKLLPIDKQLMDIEQLISSTSNKLTL